MDVYRAPGLARVKIREFLEEERKWNVFDYLAVAIVK